MSKETILYGKALGQYFENNEKTINRKVTFLSIQKLTNKSQTREDQILLEKQWYKLKSETPVKIICNLDFVITIYSFEIIN
jgi:hypothetical protein